MILPLFDDSNLPKTKVFGKTKEFSTGLLTSVFTSDTYLAYYCGF